MAKTVRAMELQGAVRIVTRVLESTRGAALAVQVTRHMDPIIGSMLRHEDEDAAERHRQRAIRGLRERT